MVETVNAYVGVLWGRGREWEGGREGGKQVK
jgi:hypothetical protein